MDDYKELTDREILRLVEDNIHRSVGYYDSQLSRERQNVTEYYNASLPKPAHDGNSKYISQDVYNAVESLKAGLLETFSAGRNIVKFAPQTPDDVLQAEIASSYTDHVLFNQNDFYSVASDVIHDGLTSRVGICKVYWEGREEYDIREFEGITQDALDMMLAEDDVELVDSETKNGMVSGSISIARDASQVMIEAIPPETFLIEPQARSLEHINFCAHRTRKTLSELREMGFEDDVLENIGDHEDVEMESDPEVLARHEEIGQDRGFNAHGYQDQVRSCPCV